MIFKICTRISKTSPRLLLNMAKRHYSDYEGFKKLVDSAQNIVALTGAGVSAESGIPVFRGAGGWWRSHRATELATPEAFATDPALVWEFYHYRREVAFNSSPNNVCNYLLCPVTLIYNI
ncbi:hypothetical protein AMK59_6784 [Oryctes borbonicus]|uniref:Deacetylase sirtuin-type domain-containing protein n=1 Tax=Oryctes borbonicus TaxID=1629725 RepID=A0A0T6AUJ4_9SCAR|nr:hypothetical protein AMK59_6784 [Oryctes borbonicus]